MAEFSKLVITNKGQALLAKMIAGSGNIEFTQISASSTAYTTDAQLVELTSLTDVKQTSLISKITRTNEVAIEVEAAFTNTELTEGYHMRILGLYAKDPDNDEEEILYAVTREISGNCYIPAYNGITVSGAYVQLITTVGNAESVSLEVNQAAVATIKDIIALNNRVTAAEQNIEDLQNISHSPLTMHFSTRVPGGDGEDDVSVTGFNVGNQFYACFTYTEYDAAVTTTDRHIKISCADDNAIALFTMTYRLKDKSGNIIKEETVAKCGNSVNFLIANDSNISNIQIMFTAVGSTR